jgi:D-amino-acid dehydrogenase
MKTIILGAGLIGVSSAYFLKQSGHDVTVIDRQNDVALETSFANGGQVSVCYSEPWSNISNLKKILGWIGKEDSPILFKPHASLQQILWGMQFLYECLPSRNHQNIRDMIKIAMYSRQTLQSLRDELSLNYEQETKGILTYYCNEKSYQAGVEASEFMQQYGVNRVMKNAEETFEIEPVLRNATFDIIGSDYTFDDESGNAKIFTELLKAKCIELGVQFIFNQDIKNIHLNSISGKIDFIETTDYKKDNSDDSGQILNKFEADNFVCALGSYTPLLTKKLGIYLPIYPAKGYSATIDIIDSDKINYASLTDADKKMVFTRLGNKLRIAGTAEFNGYNLDLNPTRCQALLKRTKKLFPEGLDYNSVKYWTGLRPATPGNVPIISQSKIENFYINSGHGTLGWTMAAGSGKLISQIINQETLFS